MADNIETPKRPAGLFPSPGQWRGRALSRLRAAEPAFDRLLEKAWVSYLLIGALQTKILWDIWAYRDLTSGDTSSYFSGSSVESVGGVGLR